MFDEDIVWETLEEDLERVSSQKSVDDAAAGRVLARRMEKDEFEVEFRTMEDEYFTCFDDYSSRCAQQGAEGRAGPQAARLVHGRGACGLYGDF